MVEQKEIQPFSNAYYLAFMHATIMVSISKFAIQNGINQLMINDFPLSNNWCDIL